MQLLNRRSNGIDIGSELCAKLEELEQRVKELEMREYKLVERIDALQRGTTNELSAREVLASDVRAACESQVQKARTVYVALSAEMHYAISDRSLVEVVKHYPHWARVAGLNYSGDNPQLSMDVAKYLAGEASGPNRWGSPTTRRLHKWLDSVGCKPAERAR